MPKKSREPSNDWMQRVLGSPEPEPQRQQKSRELSRSRVRAGGEVVPTPPAELERERSRNRERQERERATKRFNQETGRICMRCGKVVSGPHTGESGGAESAQTHTYKGHKYSGAYCPGCRTKMHQEGLAQYAQYRREHPRQTDQTEQE